MVREKLAVFLSWDLYVRAIHLIHTQLNLFSWDAFSNWDCPEGSLTSMVQEGEVKTWLLGLYDQDDGWWRWKQILCELSKRSVHCCCPSGSQGHIPQKTLKSLCRRSLLQRIKASLITDTVALVKAAEGCKTGWPLPSVNDGVWSYHSQSNSRAAAPSVGSQRLLVMWHYSWWDQWEQQHPCLIYQGYGLSQEKETGYIQHLSFSFSALWTNISC